MTCPHCAAAAKGPHHIYQRSCKACCARDIAAGPHFHRSRREGRQVKEYRAQLAHYGVTHEAVVQASQAGRVPA